MTNFTIHNTTTAPEGSRAILEGAQKGMGFVPNLFGLFANSPAVLDGYTTLAGILDAKTDLSETERQVLFMSISAKNGCEYCVAAHSTIAKGKRVPDDVIAALRSGAPLADPKLEALRSFALAVVERRGWIESAELAAFRAAGYGERHALEVVLAAAFKTISNYANHIGGTALDPAFQPQEWKATAAV